MSFKEFDIHSFDDQDIKRIFRRSHLFKRLMPKENGKHERSESKNFRLSGGIGPFNLVYF
jgi:hypothetical protein